MHVQVLFLTPARKGTWARLSLWENLGNADIGLSWERPEREDVGTGEIVTTQMTYMYTELRDEAKWNQI